MNEYKFSFYSTVRFVGNLVLLKQIILDFSTKQEEGKTCGLICEIQSKIKFHCQALFRLIYGYHSTWNFMCNRTIYNKSLPGKGHCNHAFDNYPVLHPFVWRNHFRTRKVHSDWFPLIFPIIEQALLSACCGDVCKGSLTTMVFSCCLTKIEKILQIIVLCILNFCGFTSSWIQKSANNFMKLKFCKHFWCLLT